MRVQLLPGAILLFLPAMAGAARAAGNDPILPTIPLPVSASDLRPGAAPLPVIPADQAPAPSQNASPAAIPVQPGAAAAASPGQPGAIAAPNAAQSGVSAAANEAQPAASVASPEARLPVQIVNARDDVPQQERLSPAIPVTPPGSISATPAGEPATFQGRVAGSGPFAGAQVALVTLKPSPWTDAANFQWTAVRADGTFSIRADRDRDAGKTLALSMPGQALTFLHWDFAPGQSAREITLTPSGVRHASVTVTGPAGVNGQTVTVEVFDARDYRGPSGEAIARQRLGVFTGPGAGVPADLPADPVGLYVSAPGLAAYYQIVDPVKAGRFDFHLLKEGAISVRVVTRGAPAPGVTVLTGCPDAPFSWRRRTTDREGRIQLTGLPPGEYRITANGAETTARIRSGETASAVLTLGGNENARGPAASQFADANGDRGR
jgi:hypothetical protein